MLQQVFTSSLELLLNKALSLSTNQLDLKKLEQKTLAINLAEFNFPISLTVNQDNILVSGLTERADCTIHTSLKTLQALKAQQQITELIKQDELDLSGDIKVAQQFASLVENLDIDWQSELANHIGDIPTHKLMQLGRKVAKKVQFASEQIQADASEYLVHEQRLLVTNSQIKVFNQDVTNISKQVEALEDRITRLTNHPHN